MVKFCSTCVVTRCNGRNSSLPRYMRRCRCDSECDKYGDCCIDSPYKSNNKKSSFECEEVKFMPMGVYIKRTCTPFMNLDAYKRRQLCRQSADLSQQISNITLKLPVTSSNGVTYGNKFCAACDRITNYTTWNAHFSCETHLIEVNATANLTKYVYNSTLQKWTYVDGNTTEACVFSPIPPQSARNRMRRCRANLVQSCPTLLKGGSLSYYRTCTNYTSIVQDINGTYYKNEYCALCNNVSSADILCKKSNYTRRRSNQTRSTSTATSITSMSTVSTPSNSATAPYIFPASISSNNTTNLTTQVREYLHILVKNNCNDLLDSLSLTKIVVETKSFTTMKRTYIKEANLISAFPKRICKQENIEESKPFPEESIPLKIFVNFGLVVSILFTLSHLNDFLFLSNTSTSTQRSFAYYSIVLVITNATFLVGNMTDNFCHLLGSITYFTFLASFFWLGAISFDVACKTWCCVQNSDIFSEKHSDTTKNFTMYSLISWISPVLIIFVMDYEAEIYGEFIYVGTIYETCWFPGDETFVKFFILPLTISISVNFAFWLFSAYVVWLQRTVVAKLFSEHGIDFKFHTGLIITSNLMWSTALISVYYENSFLWVCFACLEATLGLLVYLCSPVKHAFAIKIAAYLNERFLPVNENEISK